MAKYYIPEIEKIHIGLECEVRPQTRLGLLAYCEGRYEHVGYWREFVVGKTLDYNLLDLDKSPYDIAECIDFIGRRALRIRCLDHKDIEHFEFINRGSLWFTHSSGDYRLRKWKGEIDIYRWYSEDDNQIIFRGKIKNKSVFKQVLEMVGVL